MKLTPGPHPMKNSVHKLAKTSLLDFNPITLVFTCEYKFLNKNIQTVVSNMNKKLFYIALNVSDQPSNYSIQVICHPLG